MIGGYSSGEVTIELETPEIATPSGQWVFSGRWFPPDEEAPRFAQANDGVEAPVGEAGSPEEGGAGSDEINGGFGHDTIDAGRGDDTVSGGRGKDMLLGGAGRDDLSGNGGGDALFGGAGRDMLDGGRGHDDVRGQSGGDLLVGGVGRDSLKGGAGQDTLIGGRGRDELTGGIGRDYFEFSSGDGQNTITDFTQRIDKISITKGAKAFSDLQIGQFGDDVLLRFSNVVIRVEDQDADAFDASDFIF